MAWPVREEIFFLLLFPLTDENLYVCRRKRDFVNAHITCLKGSGEAYICVQN